MIIGFLGHTGVGKSTAAKHVVEKYGGKRFALADPLKRIVRDVFGFTDEQLWGSQEQKNAIDPRFGFSPRQLLQKLGTEGCRRHLGNDVWVRALLLDVELWWRDCGIGYAVVEDVRFANEVDGIRKAGGRIIKLIRQGVVTTADMTHQSETEMDGPLMSDAVVDGTEGPHVMCARIDRVLDSWSRF